MYRIPFSLEAWLKNKSQKIVTRGGQNAHYVGQDSAGWQVFEIDQKLFRYHHSHLFNGPEENPNDLFLLPAPAKLTPFEEAVKGLCWRLGMGEVIKEDEQIRAVAGDLLKLANEESPAGWSDKDEKMLWSVINGLRSGIYDEEKEWLANRHKYLRPKPHWKPTEEQITVLEFVIGNHIFGHQGHRGVLESLLFDLKKL